MLSFTELVNYNTEGVDDGDSLQLTEDRILTLRLLGEVPLEPLTDSKYGVSDLVGLNSTAILGADLGAAAILWDTEAGEILARFPAYDGNAMAVAASADGNVVALGTTGNESTVRVWERDGL